MAKKQANAPKICKNPGCKKSFVPGHYGDRQEVCSGNYVEKCSKKCPGKTCKKCAGKGSYKTSCVSWYRRWWSQTRKPPRGIPEEDQKRALAYAKKNDPRYWALLVVASRSALRKGELLGMTWADVEDGKEIRAHFPLRGQWDDNAGFKETKTDSGRIAFLLKEAREALAEIRKTIGKTDPPGDRIWTYTEVSTWEKWISMQRKLKIVNPQTRRPFRFHDWRHSAAIRALKRTGKLSDASTLCGHKNPATTAIYTQQSPEDFVASLEK
jgi:integrase